MPGWLVSALQLLRATTFGTPTRALATGLVGGQALEAVAGEAEAGSFLGAGLPTFLGAGAVKRRRRRKALTNTDVATALTIASAISKKAAENFILMRVRRG